MFPIPGLERVSNWFRGVSEPFARPVSAQALRIILIIMPGAVLISKGFWPCLLALWAFASWIIPILYPRTSEVTLLAPRGECARMGGGFFPEASGGAEAWSRT
jgi:hypothetical protein